MHSFSPYHSHAGTEECPSGRRQYFDLGKNAFVQAYFISNWHITIRPTGAKFYMDLKGKHESNFTTKDPTSS